MNVMDVTRWLMNSARERSRLSEACRVSSGIPVDPTTVRRWLDRGLTPERIREHSDWCLERGRDPCAVDPSESEVPQ